MRVDIIFKLFYIVQFLKQFKYKHIVVLCYNTLILILTETYY